MKKKLWIIGLFVILVLAGTIACGMPESVRSVPTTTTAYAGIEEPQSDMIGSAPPKVIPAPAPAPGYDQGEETTVSYSSMNNAATPIERMIIRSGDMYLVVEDVSGAMQQIVQMADTYQGWVVTSNSWQDRDRMMGNITIRVAAERFNEAMTVMRNLAVEVRSESTSGQDVTEEYTDLNAKLVTLEASADQLLALMEQAGTVEEILEVQRELTKTNTEIEQVKGRMQYLEESSSTSLISVNLEQSKLTVEFNADSRTVKEDSDIRFFADISGGFTPYSYEWDFGDDETSTEERPVHDYNDDGTYTVTLKVTDDRGSSVIIERENYITVLAGWNPGNIVDAAANGLVGFGRVIVNILIWVGIFSPVWIVIGAVIFFAVRRKRKKAG